MNKNASPLPQKVIEDALRHFFPDPQIAKITPFHLGVENLTMRLEGNFGSVVLRVWGEQHSRMGARKVGDIQDELAFMEACRAQQVPVPKIYLSDAGRDYEELPGGRKFCVMDYVEGDEPTNFTKPMIETLAQAVARMDVVGQTFRFPAPRSLRGEIFGLVRARIEEYQSLGKPIAFIDDVVRHLDEQLAHTPVVKLPSGPIHGDVIYQNIKFDGERLSGIFDFDDCRESYLIEDILKTVLFALEDPEHCVLNGDIANAVVFVEAYEQIRPLSDAEKAALPTLATARFLHDLLKYYLYAADRPGAKEKREGKVAAYETFRPLFEEVGAWVPHEKHRPS